MANKLPMILSAPLPTTGVTHWGHRHIYPCLAFCVGSEDLKWEYLAYALGCPALSTSLITEDGDEEEEEAARG